MNNRPVITVFWFVLGLAFQVMILNNIYFLGYLNPYYYPVLILLIAPTINQHRLLIIAFLTGFMIDAFEQTGAIHASATIILAYLRPVFLRLISTQSGRELTSLSMSSLGLKNFALYVGIAVFCHHIVLYFLDSLRLSNLDVVLWRSFQTSFLSFVVILLIHGVSYRSKGWYNG
jgi:hypothetical protein